MSSNKPKVSTKVPGSSEWHFVNDLKSDKSTLTSVLEFTNGFAKNPPKLAESHKGYQAISFLLNFSTKHASKLDKENIDDIFFKKSPKLYKIMWEIFKHLVDTRKKWIIKLARPFREFDIEEKTSDDERSRFIFGKLSSCFNSLLQFSKSLNLTLNKQEPISAFLSALNDDDFTSKIEECILHAVFNTVKSLSNLADSNKSEWQKADCVHEMLTFRKDHLKFETDVFMIISSIASDKELEDLRIVDEMVAKFTRMLQDISESTNKTKLKFFDDEFKISLEENIPIFLEEGQSVPITAILRSLYKISVNDKIKMSLYQQIKENHLKTLIIHSDSQVVKQHAVQILAQLCFYHQVLDNLIQDQELCDCISKLSKDEKMAWKRLSTDCQEIQWLIADHMNHAEAPDNAHQQFDVTISFNHVNLDVCNKIKKSLESNGLKVCMDLSHGTRVAAIVKAIHGSKCVLMCVSESYRQSIYNRSEAEYANKHGKLIIPLIMQKGYGQVHGWLDSVMSSKTCVDFSKVEYDTAIQDLLKHLKPSKGGTHAKDDGTHGGDSSSHANLHDVKLDVASTHVDQSVSLTASDPSKATPIMSQNFHSWSVNPVKRKQVEAWGAPQVSKWFADQKVDKAIVDYLSPCTGEDLSQFYNIQLYSPQFYYQMVNQMRGLTDPRTFSKFSIALKKLFD